jgi:hypothetical protein
MAVLNNRENEYISSTESNTETVEVGHTSKSLGFRYNLINSKNLKATTRSPVVNTYQEADNTCHTTTLAHSIISQLHTAIGVADVDLSDFDRFTSSKDPITWSNRDDDEKDEILINCPCHEPNIPLLDGRNTIARLSNITWESSRFPIFDDIGYGAYTNKSLQRHF